MEKEPLDGVMPTFEILILLLLLAVFVTIFSLMIWSRLPERQFDAWGHLEFTWALIDMVGARRTRKNWITLNKAVGGIGLALSSAATMIVLAVLVIRLIG